MAAGLETKTAALGKFQRGTLHTPCIHLAYTGPNFFFKIKTSFFCVRCLGPYFAPESSTC